MYRLEVRRLDMECQRKEEALKVKGTTTREAYEESRT